MPSEIIKTLKTPKFIEKMVFMLNVNWCSYRTLVLRELSNGASKVMPFCLKIRANLLRRFFPNTFLIRTWGHWLDNWTSTASKKWNDLIIFSAMHTVNLSNILQHLLLEFKEIGKTKRWRRQHGISTSRQKQRCLRRYRGYSQSSKPFNNKIRNWNPETINFDKENPSSQNRTGNMRK